MAKRPKTDFSQYDVTGHVWAVYQRGAYWGPFSTWDRVRPSFFSALAVSQLDAGARWEKFHQPPPGFPFPILGQPAMRIDASGLGYYRNAMDLIRCGCRLDNLALRLRLLAAETACFRALQGGAR